MRYSHRISLLIISMILVMTAPLTATGQTQMGGMFKDDGAGGTKVEIHGPDVPTTMPTSVTIGTWSLTNITHGVDEQVPTEFFIRGDIAVPIASMTAGSYDVTIDGTTYAAVPFDLDTGGGMSGPGIAVDKMDLDFGNVTAGGSATMTVNIQSVGTDDLHVNSITITDAGNFSVDKTVFTLAPQATEMVTVTFQPTAGGDFTADMSIESDAPYNPVVIHLQGTADGGGGTGPMLEFSPASLDFGNVLPNATADLTLTIKNNGDSQLEINSIAPTDGPYVVTATIPMYIDPQQQQSITVTFQPTEEGDFFFTLEIQSNSPGAPHYVPLNGASYGGGGATGPGIAVDKMDLDFGNVTAGGSATMTVNISNPGDADLHVTDISITDAGNFTADPTAATIAPQGSQAVNVTFHPTADDDSYSSLEIYSDAPQSPVVVSLHGSAGTGSVEPVMVSRFAIMSVPDGGAGTEFWVYGSGFSVEIINSVEIWIEGSSSSLYSFQSGSFEVGTDYIKIVHNVDMTTLSAGNYFAIVYLSDGSSQKTSSMPFDPGGPPAGSQLWGGFGDDGSGGTKVHIGGPDVPASVTNASINIGGTEYPLSGIQVFPDPGGSGYYVIDGSISVPFSNLAEGNYSVTIDGQTYVDVYFVLESGPPAGELNVSGLNIASAPDGSGGTEIRIYGSGFTTSNILSFDMYFSNTYYFTLSVGELTISEYEIMGIHSYDYNSLPAGDCYAIVKTTEGDLTTPSIYFEPGGQPGGPLFGEFMDDGAGGTIVRLMGSDVPATATTASIMIGSVEYSLTNVQVMAVPDVAGEYFLEGSLALGISNVYDGNFDVTIDGVSYTAVPFTVATGPGPGPQIWGWFSDDGTGNTTVMIGGPDVPATVSTASIIIGGTPYTLTDIEVNTDPYDSGSYVLKGNIPVAFSNLNEGEYAIDINNVTYDNVYFVRDTSPPVNSEVWGSFSDDGSDGTIIRLSGPGVPASTESAIFFLGNVEYPITGMTFYANPDGSGNMVLEGSIAIAISSLSEGTYTIDIGDMTYDHVYMIIETGPGPDKQIFGSFSDDGASGTIVRMGGPVIPATAESASITIGITEYPLSQFQVLVDPGGSGYYVITGTISVPFSTLGEGTYDVTIDGQVYTGAYFIIESVPSDGPQLWGGEYSEGLTTSVTEIVIWGYKVPADFTSVSVNINGTEYTLTDIEIEADPYNPDNIEIEGNIPVDVTTLPQQGEFTVTIVSPTAGTLTFENIHFQYMEDDDDEPEFFHFTITAIDETSSEMKMYGYNFEEIPFDGLKVYVTDDPNYAGTLYEMTNISVNYNFNEWEDDEITAVVNAPASFFTTGREYYFRAEPADGDTHDFSLSMNQTIPVGPEPPQIYDLAVPARYTDSLAVEWRTNVPASTEIGWMLADDPSDYPSDSLIILEYTLEHKVVLTGLEPNTEYRFWVRARDEQGTVSPPFPPNGWYAQTLASADNFPPVVVKQPSIIAKDATSVLVNFETDEPTYAFVEYALESEWDTGTRNRMDDPNITNNHLFLIEDLTADTRYKAVFGVTDAGGNGPVMTEEFAFSTLATTNVNPPVFTEFPVAVGIDTASAKIQFKTNKPTIAAVRYGLSGNFMEGTRIKTVWDSTLTTEHSVNLANLTPRSSYSFEVGIVDANGQGPIVSPPSTFYTLGQADNIPPVIVEGPFFDIIDTSKVMIKWWTDEIASSIVWYNEGNQPAAAPQEVELSDLVIEHKVILSGLKPGTEYTFKVGSKDAKGNGPAESGIFHFFTPAGTVFEPPFFIRFPEVVNTDTANAVVVFETNKLTTMKLYYALESETNVENYQLLEDNTLLKEHKVLITGLLPSTGYKYYVEVFDAAGNGPAVSQAMLFYTQGAADNMPPRFLGFPSVIDRDTARVTIQWFTDEVSTSVVEYMEIIEDPAAATSSEVFSIFVENPALVTDHKMVLTGLKPNSTYMYRVQSTDGSGNTTSKGWFGFKTLGVADTQPPIIVGFPYISELDTNRITVRWETDELSTSIVEYAPEEDFDDPAKRTVVEDLALVRAHVVRVTGLTPGVKYMGRVGSVDAKGNGPTYSDTHVFETLQTADTQPPVIFGQPNIDIVDTSSVVIYWMTDEYSNGRVDYYPATNPAQIQIRENQELTSEHKIFLKDLIPGTLYFFNIFSTDGNGNGPTGKGPFTFTTPQTADDTPPVFVQYPFITHVDTSVFVIEWVTNERANAFVEFVPVDAPEDTLVVDDQELRFNHTLFVGGLIPGAEYSVKAYSFDARGNGPVSSDWFTVRTKSYADNQPPYLNGFPNIVDVDTTSITIFWETSEPSMYDFEYGLFSQWPGETKTVQSMEFKTAHTLTLTNLMADRPYKFRIRLTDRAGNSTGFMGEHDFHTAGMADIFPPQFVGLPRIASIDSSSLTVEWYTDESASSIVLVIGVSGDTIRVEDQTLVNFHSIYVNGLTPGAEYSIMTGSVDAKGNGPNFSVPITIRTRAAADTSPPKIIGFPGIASVDTASATIVWKTNESASSIVEYGPAADWPNSIETFVDEMLTVDHSVFLAGLQVDTGYMFRVGSTDAARNGPTWSFERTFRTKLGADMTPPALAGPPYVIGVDTSRFTVVWGTNENATSIVEYAETAEWATAKNQVVDNTLIQFHNVLVPNLKPNTEYTYRVGSVDAAGNGPMYSREFVIKTAGQTDTRPPKIINIPAVVGVDTSSATIVWMTNEAATSIIEYNLESEWLNGAPLIITDQQLTLEHRLLIPDLMSGVKYRFRVGSIDEKGNGPAYSFEQTFMTMTSADVKPPVMIGFPAPNDLDTNKVVIGWKTDEPSSSIAYIREEGQEGERMVEDGDLVTDHRLLIDALEANTRYVVKVASFDAANNGHIYENRPVFFKTLAAADVIPPVFYGLPRISNLDTASVTIGVTLDEEAEVSIIIARAAWFEVPDSQHVVRNPDLMKEHVVDIFDLIPATGYKFKVTAVDRDGNGPTETPVFNFTTPAAPDTKPPIIVGFPVVAEIDTASAIVKYKTNENANTEIHIWIKGEQQNENMFMDPAMVQQHSMFLSNLQPGTEYEAYVQSFDRIGNGPTSSNVFTFRTRAAADIKPPVVIGVPAVEGIDTSSATIVFKTDEEGTTIVKYVSALAPEDTLDYEDLTLVLDHRSFITSLMPGTIYQYMIGSVDSKGNGPVYSPMFRFKTPAVPDTRPPVFLGVPSERNVDTTFATIIWGTDEPATSLVEVREAENPANVFEFRDGELVSKHKLFVSGLMSGTKYEYRVSSVDASNNGPSYYNDDPEFWSDFETRVGADIVPPQITFQPSVIGLTHQSATIKFKTNEESFAGVNYGIDELLGTVVEELEGGDTHTLQLTNLADSTQYFFRIEGKDIAGNVFAFPPAEEPPLVFMTKPMPAVADVEPPRIIEGPVEVDIESDGFTVMWKTDKMSNSAVDYGLDETTGETITQDNAILTIGHKVRLTYLAIDTTYYYRIRSRGENNKEIESALFSIRTLAQKDTFAVKILEGPIANFILEKNATIEWRTDKNALSRVDYGTHQDSLINTFKANEIEGVKFHQARLSELKPGTVYFYRVSSIGANGKEGRSGIFNFKTLDNPDTAPPRIINGPAPTHIENASVTIEWATDELSTSIVEYGPVESAQPRYTVTFWVDEDASGVMKHKAVLTGLEPGREYDYRVKSVDLSPQLNEIVSHNRRFKTLEQQATDITPPVLIAGPIVDRSDKVAIFNWETDENSDSFVYLREIDSTGTAIEANFRKYGDERKVTTHVVTVPNLVPGARYEFQIASRDLSGNLFSWPVASVDNSVLKTLALRKVTQPPGGGGNFYTSQDPDTQLPIIVEGPSVVAKTASTITIEWKTDERSDSFVEFGPDTLYGEIKGETSDITEHSITLTNLTAATLYNFKVQSTDPSDNGPTYSQNAAVSTDAVEDNTPPKITSGPVVESITNDQATIIWETDEYSDTHVEYGTTTEYGSVRLSTDDVKVHTLTLTNLTANTTYHFRVASTDISDNGPTTGTDATFTTAVSPDATPPVISAVEAVAITDKTATITFSTNELGDTFVDYGLTTSLDVTAGSSEDVTSHSITLTNLQPDATYHYRVGSIDKSDNETLSGEVLTFNTLAASDTEAPAAPAGLTAIAGSGQIKLSWTANSEGDLAGYNVYRDSGSGFQLIATRVTDTFYNESGLTNGTAYSYKLTAVDVSNNISSESAVVSDTPEESKSPTVPAPFFPVDGRHLNVGEINLVIDNATMPAGRDYLVYEFVIAEESDFFNQVAYADSVVEGDQQTTWYSSLTLEDGKTYYWKARAYDGLFYSDWSDPQYFVADAQQVTSVELVDFRGIEVEGAIQLIWETASENDVAGYNLYRSTTKDKGFEPVNDELILAGEDCYVFDDNTVDVGRVYYYKLEYVDLLGGGRQFDAIQVEVVAPTTYKLHQNYPNPFNPETTIKFELPKPGMVRIVIYNILGQEVRTLVNSEHKAGYHMLKWDGADNSGRSVASGMYIYRIIATDYVQAKKMLLIR